MSDENERPDASAGSVAMLQWRIAELETAIRRLAEQDATLSVCEGAVTVTMDATLTDAEREAIENAAEWAGQDGMDREAATLRGLLKRLG
jgi:hypothetical protein